MKKENETRNEHGTRLRPVILMVLVLALCLSVMAVPVAAIEELADAAFEIEGNHTALNVKGWLGQDASYGLDWRWADMPYCSPGEENYLNFGVIENYSFKDYIDPDVSGAPFPCLNYDGTSPTYGCQYGELDWSEGAGYLIQDGHKKVGVGDQNIFGGGEKFNAPEDWTIVAGNVPAASELTNVYVYPLLAGSEIERPASVDPCNLDAVPYTVQNTWMMFGMERVKQQGDFWLDFEFNQVPWLDTSTGPTRTEGDIAVGFKLKGNPTSGDDLDILLLKYDPPNYAGYCQGGGYDPDLVTIPYDSTYPNYFPDAPGWCTVFSGNAEQFTTYGSARMNNETIRGPYWGSLDEAGVIREEIPLYQFAEAAINFSALGIIDPGCPGFGTVNAKSRASGESFTSQLKDLAGPLNLGIQCSLEGYKWLDTDLNGTWDGQEDGLSGWTINLVGAGTSQTTTTDEFGHYIFTGLSDGEYDVSEICPAGWVQTAPEPTDSCGSGIWENVPVNALTLENRIVTDINFGNFPPNVDIDVEKYVWNESAMDWADADDIADAVMIPLGGKSDWNITVWNLGNVPVDLTWSDDYNGTLYDYEWLNANCNDGAGDVPQTLAAGGSYTCILNDTAVTGYFFDNVTVEASFEKIYTDSDYDPAWYFGAAPCIDIEKFTNGVDTEADGCPFISVGDDVTWTYEVENCGNVDLIDVAVTDSETGVVPAYVSGDDGNGILEVGETWIYEASGTAVEGDYENTGYASGTDPVGIEATDEDDSCYFGETACINVTKQVRVDNGEGWSEWYDAEEPIGPVATVDSMVQYRIQICNCDNTMVTIDKENITDTVEIPDYLGLDWVTWESIPALIELESGQCSEWYDSSSMVFSRDYCEYGPQFKDNVTVMATTQTGWEVFNFSEAYVYLACPCIDVTKEISNDTGCTWYDANTAMDAVPFGEGDIVDLQFNVTNCGNVNLTNILYTDIVDGTLDDLGWTCDIPEPFEPGDYFICTADMTAECGMHYDVVNVSGEYDGIKVSDQDPAYYNVICDKWCGLTIGFWQNNVGKYLDAANGRQVCDEFFETVSPGEVTGGVCGSEPTCDNWSCVSHILALDTDEWTPKDSEDKALRQIVAINLTIELYGGEEDVSGYLLVASDFECKDLISECPGDEYCPEHNNCAESIREACDGDSCYVTTAWQYVLGLYEAGEDYGKAYEIADCINNYKFGCYDEIGYECDSDSCSCSVVYGDEILGDLIDSLICNDMSSFDGCDWVTSLVEEPQETDDDVVLNPAGKAPPGKNKDKENMD